MNSEITELSLVPHRLPRRALNIQQARRLPWWLRPFGIVIGVCWSLYLSTLRVVVDRRDLAPDRSTEASLYLMWCAKSFTPTQFARGLRSKYLTYTDNLHLLLQCAAGLAPAGQLPYAEHSAWRDISACLKSGKSVISYADGPYGPPGELKAGLVAVALRSGIPIMVCRVEARSSVRLKWRWDRYEVPLPFSSVRISFIPVETRGRRAADLFDETAAHLGVA